MTQILADSARGSWARRAMRAMWIWVVALGVTHFAESRGADDSRPVSASSSAPGPPEYTLLRLTSDDGLPHNRVEALTQTADGYIWVGTWFGLARFDGVQCTVFDRRTTPALSNDTITTLQAAGTNDLWIGTVSGLVRYSNGAFLPVGRKLGQPGPRVLALAEAEGRGVWMATTTGLCLASNDVEVLLDGLEVRRVQRLGSSGKLLLQFAEGWMEFDPTTRKLSSPHDEVSPGNRPAAILQADARGWRWAATEDGIYRRLDAQWILVWTAPRNQRSGFAEIVDDHLGNVWFVGSRLGVCRWDGWRMRWDLFPDSTPARNAQRMLIDHERNVWLGSVEGLIRLHRRSAQTIGRSDGLSADEVWSVCRAPDGAVWIASAGGLDTIRDGRIEHRVSAPSMGHGAIHCVMVDREGTAWFGREGIGLHRLVAGAGQEQRVEFPMRNTEVRALYQDAAGDLWVGTDEGAHRLRAGKVVPCPELEAFAGQRVLALLNDRRGRLWAGTEGGGVCRIEGPKATWFRQLDGLADDHVLAIHEDDEGLIWLGTEGGLSVLQGERLTAFRREDGLPESVINQILETPDHYFWLAGLRGVHRVRRDDLLTAIGRAERLTRRMTLGLMDGMETAETNGDRQPAGCVGADGRVWFATGRGVVAIDTRLAIENVSPPKVAIEAVLSKGEVVFGGVVPFGASQASANADSRETFEIGPRQRELLEIRYTANTFVQPSKIQFEYRLQPTEAAWHDADGRRVALYSHLDPGRYTFEVRAANSHGIQSTNHVTISFRVVPMVYESLWFWGIVSALVSLGVLAALRRRLRRQRENIRAEVAGLERERTRIARDLHDDVGANLTGLGLKAQLAALELQGESASKLNELARDIRALVDRMRDVIWAVNPECDTLENLVNYLTHYVESFLTSAGRRCRLDVPAVLPPLPVGAEARHHLLSITKEALNNSVRHAEADEVFVRISVDLLRFQLMIRDNGVGFDPDDSELVRVNGSGHGLGNMRQRIEDLNGVFFVRSAPGEGTEITAELQLSDLAKARTRIHGSGITHEPHAHSTASQT